MDFIVRYTCFAFITLMLITSAGQADCRDDILPSTPDERFVINDDGTVSDTATGLMWKRCTEGQTGTNCDTGRAGSYSWRGALQHAEQTPFAGYSDWRLPNIKELQSIVEQRCHTPAINLTVFPNTPRNDWFWSASPYAGSSNYAWYVYFNPGYVSNNLKSHDDAVRLVRGGQ